MINMKPEEEITKLREQYDKIIRFDDKQVFYVAIAKYTGFTYKLLQKYPDINMVFKDKLNESVKNIQNIRSLIPNDIEEKIINSANANEQNEEYIYLPKELYLRSTSLALQNNTDVTHAWFWMGMLREVVFNSQKVIDDILNNKKLSKEFTQIIEEYKKISFSQDHSKNTILTRNNYLNYLTLVNDFLIDELEKIPKDVLENTQNETKMQFPLTLSLAKGEVTYIASSGNKYKAKLKPGSNGYCVFKTLMLQLPEVILPFKTLAESFNKKFDNNQDKNDERRVRDAIGYVKKKLNINNEDNFFITNYGFGLSVKHHINP